MEWYVVVFIGSMLLFVLQTLISIIFGDLDFDTDLDLEIGDLFSFKGLMHFVLGASLTLTVFNTLTPFVIGLSIGIGITFAYLLKYVYFHLYRTLRQDIVYQTDIIKQTAEVYYWNYETQRGEVVLALEGRLVHIPIENGKKENIRLVPGQIIVVTGNRSLVYWFKD